ncbi:hypothetical protein DO97_11015 [Neosynechococcus sphagnicola sy1]|uniref:Uncharacterized protein n=1 Tax=Neosynechococcus sphagnicola sy1 TaxID=1497020 RepID=A0A098TKA1_9CYAN|nr:hypothetical protein [Neosynechococcus sphagnicola]KGF72272.1 hypothetical protein DO97_11015 [Neosynechococcus sphagnicola sy1]
MNAVWHRMLKSAYRREPLFSFVLTIGVVDTVIGGLGDHGSLAGFGMGTMVVALGLRWWQFQRRPDEQPEATVTHYLPPYASRPQLPPLSMSKRHPPTY